MAIPMQNRSIISFFWQHIKPYKWLYLVMLVAPITASFFPFAYTYALKLFLDAMATPNTLTYQAILFPIVLFLASRLILDFVWRVSNMAAWKAVPYVRRSILLQSYDYIQHHSYSFFQNNFTGAISSKLKGILDGYDRFWIEIYRGLFLRILKSIVNLCVLIFINAELGLFFLIWDVVFVYIIYQLSLKLNRISFAATESRHALIGQIADKISNMITLLSFVTRDRELKALDEGISYDFIPKQISVYKYTFQVQMIGGVLHLLMFTCTLFYMIHLRITGYITVGDFALIFGIILVTSEDIWHATISLQDFTHAMGDLKSALSMLWLPQENMDRKDAQSLQINSPRLAFKSVYFGYTDKESVFKDLNLAIKSGEKIGLVGHSGAGKSSLINLLLRYFNHQQGTILIDGHNIQHVTQDSLRKQIAVIPQDISLFHRSLMENIRYGNPDATDEEVIEASKKAHIHDFISSLSKRYATYVGERGVKLSGGQRQRVAIARAILKDAPILVLDEATSSLDSKTEKLIQDGLHYFVENKRKTVIAIAHRLSTLKYMDRIIVLDHGKIVEQGTHDQLIQQPSSLYKKLWELQEI